MAADKDAGHKRIAENRKARFEYRIEDTYEAGIQLTGTEVKSLRAGQANIAESYASAENGGIFLINAYIPEYSNAGNRSDCEQKHNPSDGSFHLLLRPNAQAAKDRPRWLVP